MAPNFIPGPVDVAPEVLAAQARPILPYRTPEFEAFYQRLGEKAQALFGTRRGVLMAGMAGSGMMETALRSLVTQRVLFGINGEFSHRWYQMGQANGKTADPLEVDPGNPIPPERLENALKGHDYDALVLPHIESSTGVQNDLPALIEVARQTSPDTLIIVDAISSIGGAPMAFDAWNLDLVLTSSQECLAAPPGLSLAVASERALKRAEKVPARGWYSDLLLMEKHRQNDSVPTTPAISLLFALDAQLDRILAEGLANRFERHATLSGLVYAWAIENNMRPLAEEQHRAMTTTTIRNSRGWDVMALNKFLRQRGMMVANGVGELKDNTLIIATMGDKQQSDVEELLAALKSFGK
ncbi:MAG: alanine--glyoxylate aminotransferase family protein [Anaerolineae bacterium]|nr:alanine--glyoxylate aminotransferase family protein [Anaerolineae bacterium]